jgi:hypothetical protein
VKLLVASGAKVGGGKLDALLSLAPSLGAGDKVVFGDRRNLPLAELAGVIAGIRPSSTSR